jgi:hypothetical protein
MNRTEVYEALDTEREYQDLRWGGDEHNDKHEIESFLMYTEHYLDKAKRILCTEDMTKKLHRKHTMDNIRKAAALLVCAMEQFGVDPRPEWKLDELRAIKTAVKHAEKQYIVCVGPGLNHQMNVLCTWEFSEVLWKQIGEEIDQEVKNNMNLSHQKWQENSLNGKYRGRVYHLVEASSVMEAESIVLEQYGEYREKT